jgi:hypothetical protein
MHLWARIVAYWQDFIPQMTAIDPKGCLRYKISVKNRLNGSVL